MANKNKVNSISTAEELSERMAELAYTLENSRFYMPWCYVQIATPDMKNVMTFCTDDPDNNYLISIENSKNGTGMCNSYTIVITWKPKSSITDVNQLEHLFTVSGLEATSFTMRYGYKCHSTFLVSPLYTGMITNYTCEMQNGYLHYTLTGYSSVAKLRDLSIYPEIAKEKYYTDEEIKNGKVEVDVDVSQVNPVEIASNLLAESCGYGKILPDYSYDYTVNFNSDEVKLIDLTTTGLIRKRTTLMNLVGSLLELGTYNKDDETTSYEKRTRYVLVVSDSYDRKTIGIHRVSGRNSNTKVELTVPFDWGSVGKPKDTGGRGKEAARFNLVLDFKPSYDGSVLMAASSSDSSGVPIANICSDGSLWIETSSSSDEVQDKTDADALKNQWTKLVQENYYEATLRTVGIPFDIPVLTYIKVVPHLHNTIHHSGGTYIVLSVKDRIDSSGFESTFKLMKVGGFDE